MRSEKQTLIDDPSQKDETSFWSLAAFRVGVVNIVGGLFFGYNVGYAAIYLAYMQINGKCTQFTSSDACSSVSFANCMWVGNSTGIFGVNTSIANTCQHDDIRTGVFCPALSKEACSGPCAYDYQHDKCHHVVGWNPTEIGVFAAILTLGYMFGSTGISVPLQRFGRKRSLLLVGVVGLIGAILQHIGHAVNVYGLIVFARLLVGFGGGGGCVTGPTYVKEMAPISLQKPLGVLFQVFVTVGCATAAGVGLAAAPTDFAAAISMEARFHLMMGICVLMALLIITTAMLIPESRAWSPEGEAANEVTLNDDAATVDDSSSWSANRVKLFVAVILAMGQQMTGILAIMSYSPVITAAIGLKPLVGNFVVMAWNFLTAIASVPISRRFGLRPMYLTGLMAATLSCFAVGIVVVPGVASDSVRNAVAGLGILGFIAAFEFGVGPPFFVLALDLFPEPFRRRGASFTNMVQWFLATVVSVCFPIAVQGISGGVSGNQNLGMGTVFLTFGAFGLLSWGILLKMLHPSDTHETTPTNVRGDDTDKI